MSNVIPRRPGMTSDQSERAMLTAGMSARDVAWHFQRHESTINSTIEHISANWERRGPIQIRQTAVKPRRWKTVFLRLHLDAITFFLVES